MFTGHRPKGLPFGYNERDSRCKKLKKVLKKLIIHKVKEENTTNFLSGMALGTDMFAAEIVLELKERFRDITLTAVLPCRTQSARWNRKAIARYEHILAKCDKVIVLQDEYTSSCMNKRNLYMLEHSDCVIAVWSGTEGGTANTIRFAIDRHLPVTVLDPNTLKTYYIGKPKTLKSKNLL